MSTGTASSTDSISNCCSWPGVRVPVNRGRIASSVIELLDDRPGAWPYAPGSCSEAWIVRPAAAGLVAMAGAGAELQVRNLPFHDAVAVGVPPDGSGVYRNGIGDRLVPEPDPEVMEGIGHGGVAKDGGGPECPVQIEAAFHGKRRGGLRGSAGRPRWVASPGEWQIPAASELGIVDVAEDSIGGDPRGEDGFALQEADVLRNIDG